MISVIITTIGRNSLNKAIQSVHNQTYKDYDLIVINDDKRRGGAWALNQGIEKTTGKYIAILDDDDIWVSKDKLEKQVEFLDKNPDYIAVGTKPQGQKNVNLIGTPFPHSSIMFRRSIKYNENLARAKDLDFMIRLSKLGKFGIVDCEVFIENTTDLNKKIVDCHWHRKVCLMHKEFNNWYIIYLRLWFRELKLRYYKIKNIWQQIHLI
jgi:glycosyltransferase involved in cell wall biosynthesis